MDGGNTISLKISFNSIGMESAEKFCTWCLMARNLLKDPSLPKFARDIYEHAVKQFGKFEKELEKENINRSTANDSK